MRVPYNSRRKRSVKKPKAAVAAIVPAVPAVVEEEEDDFSFISIDDDSFSQQSAIHDSTSSLYPIEEQQRSNSDVAVSILEDFFFGGSNATQKALPPSTRQQQPQRSTALLIPPLQYGSPCSDVSSELSPTSTILTPVCSCPRLDHHLSTLETSMKHYSSNSLPASPKSSQQPRRPSLKPMTRERSNSDLTSSKRNVSFTDISVREYDVELSDHPSCSFGPPIQLGWAYQETETTSVEDYEVTRSPHRREVHELVLSYNTRRRRLKQCGYKKNDIKRAQREVDRIKRERLITEFFLPASAIDETIEKVFESVRSFFRPRRQAQCHVCHIHSPPIHPQHQEQQQ